MALKKLRDNYGQNIGDVFLVSNNSDDPNIQQQFPNLTVEQAIQLLLAQQQGGK